MSEAAAAADEEADKEAEASEAAADEQAEGDEDRPPVEDDQKAALDAVREEVAAETEPPDPADEADDADDEDDVESDSGEEAESGAENNSGQLADGEDTAGDFYVDTLVSVSNMVIEEHGREDAEEMDGAMLRQMGVDDAVDELLANGDGPDMPPEQQVLLGTTVFGVAMLATKTTVLDDALENADFNL